MNTKTELLHVKNVSLIYKRHISAWKTEDFYVLKNASFRIFRGETLGVIGRNGAGKSTLLRLLAGIIDPDIGEVKRNGSFASSLLSLQLGFIQHLSGRDNAVLSAMLLGLSHNEAVAQLNEITEFSELEEFIDQPVRTYSSGMRARLGFAVAQVSDPDLLLVDEILGVGDQEFRAKSSMVMKERMLSDKTVVLVSHNLKAVEELCDRVLWIEGHKVKEIGATKHVLEKYRLG